MGEKKEALELFKSFQKLTDLDMIHLSEKELKIRDKNAKRAAILCVSKMIELCELMDGGFSFQNEILRLDNIHKELINL